MSKVCNYQQKRAKKFPGIQSTSTNITRHISQRIRRVPHLIMHDANNFSISPASVSRPNFISTIGFSFLSTFSLTALVSDDISISDALSINATHILSQPNSVLIPTARRPLDPLTSYRHTLGQCDILCSYCHALYRFKNVPIKVRFAVHCFSHAADEVKLVSLHFQMLQSH